MNALLEENVTVLGHVVVIRKDHVPGIVMAATEAVDWLQNYRLILKWLSSLNGGTHARACICFLEITYPVVIVSLLTASQL